MPNENEIKGGLYLLFQNSSGKGYVGSTNNFDRRISRHTQELRNNKHKNTHLQRAYNKDPSFEIVKNPIPDRELSFTAEQAVLDVLLPSGRLFNTSTNARYCKSEGPMSEETKRKISEANKGKQNFLGKSHSEETKEKMSAWQIGKKHSLETIEKLKEKAIGRIPSQTAIDAARAATLGKSLKPETIEKISEAKKVQVQVGEVVYESLDAAAKAHGITPGTAHHRINKSQRFPEWNYKSS